MNIGYINSVLIFSKPIFVITFHPASKVTRVEISSIDSDKSIIFVFQVNFLKVFGFGMEVVP